MKNMRNYISIFILSLMAMMVVSCQDDDFYVAEGEPMEVSINATPQIPGMESRAVLGNEVNITKYTFLYFAGTDADSKLLHACEINPNDLPLQTILMSPGIGKTYSAILLANVSFSDLGLPSKPQTGINTTTTINLGDLVNKTKNIDRLMYALKDESGNTFSADKFTWSGYIGVTPENHSLNFVVCPNLAKMSMKVTNTTTNSNPAYGISWQLKHVPTKVGFAQYALNQIPSLDTKISNQTYINYDMQAFAKPVGPGGASSESEIWYIPNNMQGDRPGARKKGNSTSPPPDATYLEFDVRSGSLGVPATSSYKIYPGIREANVSGYEAMANFDVKAGFVYDMTVQITTDGISGTVGNGLTPDAKNAVAKMKLPIGTNCYMIHPIGDRITTGNGTYYELPIDRVNEYWQGVRKGAVASTTIDDNTEWVVDVIWQDINTRAITFCDEYGNGANQNSYSGKGKNPFYFKLVNTNTTSDAQNYGNIVVGLKRKDNTSRYLWSWHLWITDYNPDAAPSHDQALSLNNNLANNMYAQNGNGYNVIDLQGGEYYKLNSSGGIDVNSYANTKWGNVQHYNSLYSGYWTTTSKALWDGTGMYADKWIMDRNLGAQAPSNIDLVEPLLGFGLYYQYGRKDPFSYNYTYDITGNTKRYTTLGAQWAKATSGTIEKGVQNPNTFYYANGKWASDASTYTWFSPIGDPLSPSAVGDKTLFDPCPKGWRIPVKNTFYFGTLNNSFYLLPENAQTSITRYSSLHMCLGLYFDVTSLSSWSIRDKHRNMALLQSTGTYKSGSTTYYRDLGTVIPLQGYIDGTTGNMGGVTGYIESTFGDMWFVDINTSDNNYGSLMEFQYSALNGTNSESRQRETRYVRYYGARMNITSGRTSYGNNVRCIQE